MRRSPESSFAPEGSGERKKSDEMLWLEGAELLLDQGTNEPRLEVTKTQVEEIKKEMAEYFSVIEKQKQVEREAAIPVQKTFMDLLDAVKTKDSERINRNCVKLAVEVFGKDFSLLPEVKKKEAEPGTEYYPSLERRNREGNERAARSSAERLGGLMGGLRNWMEGSEVPVVGWNGDEAAPVPEVLRLEELQGDVSFDRAPKLKEVLERFGSDSCQQVLVKETGKVICPSCERVHARRR